MRTKKHKKRSKEVKPPEQDITPTELDTILKKGHILDEGPPPEQVPEEVNQYQKNEFEKFLEKQAKMSEKQSERIKN